MLTSLTIERFRGIPSLTLEDLGRVNVFIGENGAGKTTVLEAAFAVTYPTMPAFVPFLTAARELPPLSLNRNDGVTTLFHRGDFSNGPEFRFVVDGEEQRLSLSALLDATHSNELLSANSYGAISDKPIVAGLQLNFYAAPDDEYVSYVNLQQAERVPATPLGNPGLHHHANRAYKGLGGFYIGARALTGVPDIADVLTRLFEAKQSAKFLQMVRAVDSRITSFLPTLRGNTPIILVDVGLPTMLPLTVMGDGFCRMAFIAAGLLYANAQVVTVDEIDSGLHTSVMKQFWTDIGKLAVKEGKQLFCTTHSEEMLLRTIDAFEDSPDLLRVFRIDRFKDGRVEATKYDYDKLRRADLASMDIR